MLQRPGSRVAVALAGSIWMMASRGAAAPPPAAVARPAAVTAAAPVAVHGVVQDEHGRPLAGATLRLLPMLGARAAAELQLAGAFPGPATAETKTAADGSFTLAAPAAGLWRLVASAAGCAERQATLQPLVEETWLTPVRLPVALPVHARVLAPSGGPAAGAMVTAHVASASVGPDLWAMPRQLARADAQGNVQLVRARGEHLDVRAVASGALVARLRDVSSESTTIRLVAGSRRAVRVTLPGGAPAAAATLLDEESALPLGHADASGQADVDTSATAPLRVHVEDADGDLVVATVTPLAPAEPARPFLLRLDPAPLLQGRVIDARTRQPVPGAVVWANGALERATTSDRAGSFALRAPAGARAALLRAAATAYFSGTQRAASGDLASGRAPTVALLPAIAITGVVLDAGGRAIADVDVAAVSTQAPGAGRFNRMRWGGEGRPRTRTHADGRFRVTPVDPDAPYELTLRAPGFAPLVQTVSPAPPRDRHELRITLVAGGRLVGRVLGDDQRPSPAPPSAPRRRTRARRAAAGSASAATRATRAPKRRAAPMVASSSPTSAAVATRCTRTRTGSRRRRARSRCRRRRRRPRR